MVEKSKHSPAANKALKLIAEMGGIVRTSQAIKAGIHPRTFYELRDSGELKQISHGLYSLKDREPISNPDLVTVALRLPHAVICLVSALAFHEITTQIPRSISIALRKDSKSPKIDYPPISIHRLSDISFSSGIEEHKIDSVNIKVYSPEKTLVDCFKFRNKIGMDIFLEALKLYKTRKQIDLDKIMKYAKICRVENIITPYLETLL